MAEHAVKSSLRLDVGTTAWKTPHLPTSCNLAVLDVGACKGVTTAILGPFLDPKTSIQEALGTHFGTVGPILATRGSPRGSPGGPWGSDVFLCAFLVGF